MDFDFLKLLGRGSFGSVHLVKRKRDNLLCACKEVSLAHLTAQKHAQALKEAQIMRQLTCPYTVQYMDSFIDSESLFLVLSYCAGGDLKQYLKGAKVLQERTVWRISLRIALGLSYLHTHHVLHRDMKSENIFFETKGGDDVCIGDLGLARVLDSTAGVASTFCGTPRYISPEGFANDNYDSKCDVWAFGVIKYELISDGHRGPWDEATGLPQLMKLVLEKEPPALPKRVSEGPLGELTLKLMIKDPFKRPSINDYLDEQAALDASAKYDLVLDHKPRPAMMKVNSDAPNRTTSKTGLGGSARGISDSNLLSEGGTADCCRRSCFGAQESGLGPRFHDMTYCEICLAKGVPDAECHFGGLTNMNFRHHCRSCGRSCCRAHSTGRHPLPQFGYTTAQRICDICNIFPLGLELRNAKLMVIAAGKKADVWNCKALESPEKTVGSWLCWAGVTKIDRNSPEMLCTLGSQPGSPLEMRDMTTDGLRHTVVISAEKAPALAASVMWHLGGAAPMDHDSNQAVAIYGAFVVVLQRDRALDLKQGCSSFRVLRLPSGEQRCFCKSEEYVTSIALHSCRGGFVVGGTKRGAIIVWGVPKENESCQVLCTLEGHKELVTSLTVSDDGTLVCSGSKDKTVRLWQRHPRHSVFKENDPSVCDDHAHGPMAVACTSAYVAHIRSPKRGSNDQTASIWNLSTKVCERDLTRDGYSVTHIALRELILVTASSNEHKVYFNSEACKIHLWHVATGTLLAEFSNSSSISWLQLAEVPERAPSGGAMEVSYRGGDDVELSGSTS